MDLLKDLLRREYTPACSWLLLEENPRRILESRPLVETGQPISPPREDEL